MVEIHSKSLVTAIGKVLPMKFSENINYNPQLTSHAFTVSDNLLNP